MLAPVALTLDRLVALTGPGLPVQPVIDGLDDVGSSLRDALPAVEQAKAGAAFVDQLDRIRNSAQTLRDSLAELVQVDGMTTFDAAFAADDAAWDAWFGETAGIVRDAVTATHLP